MIWTDPLIKIFIQLQQKYLFYFNKNIYSTSTKTFIQLQQKIISFNNKVPGHSKHRHSTKFPVPPRLNTKQHWVTQATYQKPVKYYLAIPWLEIHSCSRNSFLLRRQLLNDFSQFARRMGLNIFPGNDKEPYPPAYPFPWNICSSAVARVFTRKVYYGYCLPRFRN